MSLERLLGEKRMSRHTPVLDQWAQGHAPFGYLPVPLRASVVDVRLSNGEPVGFHATPRPLAGPSESSFPARYRRNSSFDAHELGDVGAFAGASQETRFLPRQPSSRNGMPVQEASHPSSQP